MADPVYTLAVELIPGSLTNVSSDTQRVNYTRNIATALRGIQPDHAIFELANEGGKYTSGRNGAIELLPGRDVQLSATYGGSTYNLFQGHIDRVRTRPGIGDVARSVVEAIGGGDRLNRAIITTPLFTEINAGSLFTEIMTLANVGSFYADTLGDTVPYAWFRDITASYALEQLIKSGDYRLYVDGAGTVRLRNRFWAINSGTAIGSMESFFAFDLVTDTDEVINEAKINAVPREQITSPSTVAWIDPPITIAASNHVGFWLQFLDPMNVALAVPVTSMVTPVASQDYYAAANSDGTGSDYTANLSLNMAIFGETAVVSIFNVSSLTAYLSRFQLRGYPLRALSSIGFKSSDSFSQETYGQRSWELTNALIQDYEFLKDYCANLVEQYKSPASQIEISLMNDPDVVMPLEVGAIFHVINSVTNVGSTWAIQTMTHDITLVDGLRHQVDLTLERFVGGSWFILDDAALGTLDGPGLLAL